MRHIIAIAAAAGFLIAVNAPGFAVSQIPTDISAQEKKADTPATKTDTPAKKDTKKAAKKPKKKSAMEPAKKDEPATK